MIERERHPEGKEPFGGSPENPFRRSESEDEGNVVDMAKQRGGRLAGDAQEKTAELADHARHQASSTLSNQMNVAADSLGSIAHAVRQTGVQLRSDDQTGMAGYADKAADQIERFSGYLRDNNLEDVVYEIEQVARRQPLLFLGGAFVAGFLGARFLKSSSPSREMALDRRRPEFEYGYYGRPSYETPPGYGRRPTTTGYTPGSFRGNLERTAEAGPTRETGVPEHQGITSPPVEHTEKTDEAA